MWAALQIWFNNPVNDLQESKHFFAAVNLVWLYQTKNKGRFLVFKVRYLPTKIQSKHTQEFLNHHQKFRLNTGSFSFTTICPSAPTTKTYSDKVDQSVVQVGAFGQEEAAPGTEVMEEEQILLLHDDKQFVLNAI